MNTLLWGEGMGPSPRTGAQLFLRSPRSTSLPSGGPVSEQDTPIDTPSAVAATSTVNASDSLAPAADERLLYRSIFQRLFIRPEVGAIIGIVGIWTFFWAVSETFGTVGQTFGWLDTASTVGIMAVAVSMLMIGGEFDLSSGAMTGAMGMLIIYLVKETGELGGRGFPLVIAIPLSLLVALGIGYLNGFVVERTGQPSFIITLGTFFALIGLKLGLAKRFVGQIQIGRTDEAADFDFFRVIFAAEWERNTHELEVRDALYIGFIAAGFAILTLAISELWFKRREEMQPVGLVMFLVGVGLGVGGLLGLHVTDGTAANAALVAVMAIGGFLGLFGWATWRYEPSVDRGALSLDSQMQRRLGVGLAAMILSSIAAIAIDSSSTNQILFPFTTQGVRVILILVFAGIGIGLIAMASQAALSVNAATKFVVTSVFALAIGIVALTVFVDSSDTKFRGSLFGVVLAAAVTVLIWAVLTFRFEERRTGSARADHLGVRLLALGSTLLFVGLAFRMLFITAEELAAGVPPAKTSVRLLWFILFTIAMMWVLARTRFGSWTFAVGGNKEAARQVGVPAARTKTQLFMLVSVAAWFVGLLVAFRINSIQANNGDGQEFIFIIAAVVGGTLLTGGYGTAFGGAIGACILSIPAIGISSARWNTDWRFLIVGVILLLAVVSNKFLRNKAEGIRR
ncbi:MAG: ribose/xylose/arabinose/galactoside ABC-type transport system permease subunit [Candidatus Azotimanducaceae bacterium]|jgi:ribose/xylose/arabinose/galactoside ABC-type transport system permease subunit